MGRLFWKIFMWFWGALILIALGVALSVKFYLEYSHFEIRQQLPKAQIAAVTLAIERADIDKVKEILTTLGKFSQHPIFVLDENRRELLDRPIPTKMLPRRHEPRPPPPGLIRRKLFSSDGKRYLLLAQLPPHHRQHGYVWRLPYSSTIAIIIALAISTLVCFWLARYLTRPMKALSQVSNRLAAGELGTRVGSLGRRKDEIADLARDFNIMAERIQTLIHGHTQLLSDISHELRSPLTRLEVALALAKREVADRDQQRLNSIERDLKRLEELINQVLTLSRLETSGANVRKTSFDLAALVEELVQDIQIEADQKNCHINLSVHNAEPVYGDSELLRRAVENVLRNAVYYTDNNTEVNIDYRVEKECTVIEISDAGPGVAENKREEIFEPFVRTDQARERNTGGFGLGLAIAKRAMRAHGGVISAHNNPTGGLTIRLELPSEEAI